MTFEKPLVDQSKSGTKESLPSLDVTAVPGRSQILLPYFDNFYAIKRDGGTTQDRINCLNRFVHAFLTADLFNLPLGIKEQVATHALDFAGQLPKMILNFNLHPDVSTEFIRYKNEIDSIARKLIEVFQRDSIKLREEFLAGSYPREALVRDLRAHLVLIETNPNFRRSLDTFADELLDMHAPGEFPKTDHTRSLDEVGYVPTDTYYIVKILDKLDMGEKDVFFDLGSGLGRVVSLVSLLTDATAIGVEIVPEFHHFAVENAAKNNLNRVKFINENAAISDLSSGTVFYLFKPFQGKTSEDVSKKLIALGKERSVTICGVGAHLTELRENGFKYEIGLPHLSWVDFYRNY